LETMNTRYPQNKWLHIFINGSQMDGHINAGAGTYCELFSCYMPLGRHSTAYDGKIEAIRTALRLLNLHQDKFETVVIFSDSEAALRSTGSTETVISAEARNCHALIQQLSQTQKIVLRGYLDTVRLQGTNTPIHWLQRVPKLYSYKRILWAG
jgi:exonuclease III